MLTAILQTIATSLSAIYCAILTYEAAQNRKSKLLIAFNCAMVLLLVYFAVMRARSIGQS